MMIPPKGYAATQQRMVELMSRVRSMRRDEPQEVLPMPVNAPITGSIGRGSNAPFDPFGGGTVAAPESAPVTVGALIKAAAERHGIDPALFESLVQAESDFDPNTVSHKGAMGLTQLMPGTAKSLGVTDPMDPVQNLDGGARYLAGMLKRFGGDERMALAAYNAGPGAVAKHGGIPPYKETRNYVARIMTRLENIRGQR